MTCEDSGDWKKGNNQYPVGEKGMGKEKKD